MLGWDEASPRKHKPTSFSNHRWLKDLFSMIISCILHPLCQQLTVQRYYFLGWLLNCLRITVRALSDSAGGSAQLSWLQTVFYLFWSSCVLLQTRSLLTCHIGIHTLNGPVTNCNYKKISQFLVCADLVIQGNATILTLFNFTFLKFTNFQRIIE